MKETCVCACGLKCGAEGGGREERWQGGKEGGLMDGCRNIPFERNFKVSSMTPMTASLPLPMLPTLPTLPVPPVPPLTPMAGLNLVGSVAVACRAFLFKSFTISSNIHCRGPQTSGRPVVPSGKTEANARLFRPSSPSFAGFTARARHHADGL